MHSGVGGHALEPGELVGSHAQGGEHFRVQPPQGPLAEGSKPGVELGAPAENAHHDLRGQPMILRRKAGILRGM